VTLSNRTRELRGRYDKRRAVAGFSGGACRGDAVRTMLEDDAALESIRYSARDGMLKCCPRAECMIDGDDQCRTERLLAAPRHARAGQEFVAAPGLGGRKRPRPEVGNSCRRNPNACDSSADKPLWDCHGTKLLVSEEQQSKANVSS